LNKELVRAAYTDDIQLPNMKPWHSK